MVTERRQVEQAVRRGRRSVDAPAPSGMPGRFVAFPISGPSFRKDLRVDTLSLATYDEMRMDPICRAALILIKAPILGQLAKAQIQCEDPAIKRSLEVTLLESGLLSRLGVTSLRAYDFGAAFHEIEWEAKPLDATFTERDTLTGTEREKPAFRGPGLWPKAIHEVNPATVVEIRHAEDGSYDGFIQRNQAEPVTIEAVNSFLYSNESEYGNLWGRPLTRAAYPYWFWKQATVKWWAGWVERKADPSRIARHPSGLAEDEVTPNSDVVLDAAMSLRNDSIVTMPSTPISETNNNPRWGIEELATTDRTDVFQRTKREWDSEMLKALFAPERTFTPANETGTYAEANAHRDTFLLAEDARQADLGEAVNHRIVQRVVELNWGEDAAEARVVLPGLTDEERDKHLALFEKLIASADPTLGNTIDLRQLAEDEGLPVVDEKPIEEPPGAPVGPSVPPAEGNTPAPGPQAPGAPRTPQETAVPQAPAGVAGLERGRPTSVTLDEEDVPAGRTTVMPSAEVERVRERVKMLARRFAVREGDEDEAEAEEEA